MSEVILSEGAAPETPPAGKVTIYSKVDKTIYAKDDAGLETSLFTGSGIGNIVEDVTPQLGGALDVNSFKIISIADGDIDIEPNGTGNVLLGNFTFDANQAVGAGQDNYVFTYDDASGLVSLEVATGGGGAFSADVDTQITPSVAIELDAATGTEIALDLSMTVNQTGDAGYDVDFANVTETGTGSGTKFLLRRAVGGANKFAVDSLGRSGLYAASGAGSFAGVGVFSGSVFRTGMATLGDNIRIASNSVAQLYIKNAFGTNIAKFNYLGWNDATHADSGTVDVQLHRDAAATLAQRNGTNAQTSRIYGDYASATDYQRTGIVTKRFATAVPSAASFTLSSFIPTGAFLIGITSRVDTTCTTATGYDVGDGSNADLWGSIGAVAVGTASGSADFTEATSSGTFYASAQDVVVTSTGGNFDGTGVITVCAHYLITEAD